MEIIKQFVEGVEDAIDGVLSIKNNKLSRNGIVVAIRNKSNSFILAHDMNHDVSDALIYNIGRTGSSYTRGNIEDLSNPNRRLDDLKTGKFEKFSRIANLYGFEYTEEELTLYKRVEEFNERVREFFVGVQEKERVEREEERRRTIDARAEEHNSKWDTGEGSARNHAVRGAGGGIRLRYKMSGMREYVETSQGERTTVSVVERAWRHACKYWYEGHDFPYNNDRVSHSLGNRYNSRSATITKTSISIGCQSITRDEAERFADVMGWSRSSATS